MNDILWPMTIALGVWLVTTLFLFALYETGHVVPVWAGWLIYPMLFACIGIALVALGA